VCLPQGSLNEFDFSRPPSLVKPRLQRAVKAENAEPAFAGRSGPGVASPRPHTVLRPCWAGKLISDAMANPRTTARKGRGCRLLAMSGHPARAY
jgi:hypothetical protein